MGSSTRTHSSAFRVIPIPTSELGDLSYLFAANGEALLVDPQRDFDRFLAAAEEIEAEIRWVLETHVHNDYVSGARSVAHRLGAGLLVPAGSGVGFDHVPAFHLEDVAFGPAVIRPIHTPGHTPEHVSYLILVEGEPQALFTGGSLLVGAVGRTDLLDPLQTRQLARHQTKSVRRLAELPPDLPIYPTHGGGSYCTAGATHGRTSTIGNEILHNRALAPKPIDDVVDELLAGLAPYPAYYQHMGRLNRIQAGGFPDLHPPPIEAANLRGLPDAQIIDTRPRHRFASGHLPGSLNIELGDSFATWVGWLLPFNSEMILVVDSVAEIEGAVVALARIGFDRVVGVVSKLSSPPHFSLEFTRRVTAAELARAIVTGEARQVLDVRSPTEWTGEDLPGSIHIYLPDLEDRALEQLDRIEPVWVACASGLRAAIATGVLERLGFDVVMTYGGGIQDLRGLVVRSPSNLESTSSGRFDPASSVDTWSIDDSASSGNVASYWRHSGP